MSLEFFKLIDRSSAGFDLPQLSLELLKSDADYFRAAAQCQAFAGFELVHMPGLQSLAAGCVVLAVAGQGNFDLRDSFAAFEARLAELGCRHARVYQQHPDEQQALLLRERGYQPAEEIGLLRVFDQRRASRMKASEVRLVPLQSERDWSLKRLLHRDIPQGPDGHACTAGDWVQLERRKCAAGFMEPFLVYAGETPCGAVSLSLGHGFGRLKNLVVHPDWQRRGVGVQAARLVAELARQRGMTAVGCFALKHGWSLKLYQNAGYRPVVKQIEWYREFRHTHEQN